MAKEVRGVLVRVFLVDGTPQGLRRADRVGSTVCCLSFARADYAVARRRAEFRQTGVYVLLGSDPLGERTQRAYIGEADEVLSRLDSHHRDKEFWSVGYILTTTDDSLNKAHVRYLESRLITLATAARVVSLDNGTSPTPTWLSEPDQAAMDSFLDEVLVLLPLLGVSAFDPVDVGPVGLALHAPETTSPGGAVKRPVALDTKTQPTLQLNTVLTAASGREESRGFIVFEGATARIQKRQMTPGYERLRDRLVAEGVLAPLDGERYVLTMPFVFDSPSAAASVLAGGSKNGRTEWTDGAGRTLKQLQEASVELPPAGAESSNQSAAMEQLGGLN